MQLDNKALYSSDTVGRHEALRNVSRIGWESDIQTVVTMGPNSKPIELRANTGEPMELEFLENLHDNRGYTVVTTQIVIPSVHRLA